MLLLLHNEKGTELQSVHWLNSRLAYRQLHGGVILVVGEKARIPSRVIQNGCQGFRRPPVASVGVSYIHTYLPRICMYVSYITGRIESCITSIIEAMRGRRGKC